MMKNIIRDMAVAAIAFTACNNSGNKSDYPWYSSIQPMGWLMFKHINQGNSVLNFSEFGNYSPRKH